VSAGDAVITEGLCKFYDGVEAVAGLDLTVPRGCVFGFLGPNGAGKTTTIGLLCTLLQPTAGSARVAGFDVLTRPHEVRRRIGLVFQESTLDQDLSAVENLRFQAGLFGMPRRLSASRIEQMLDLVGLTDRADVPVMMFSGGMRRRLELARGLLHTPEILFLDEPTTGLDPQTRLTIWEHLANLRREHDMTIFLTTHYLEEAENCDDIAIMDNGVIVTRGTPGELKAEVSDDTIILRTRDDEAAAALIGQRFQLESQPSVDGLRLKVANAASFVPGLVTALNGEVLSVSVAGPSLDDVFVRHTGRSIRDDGVGRLSLDEMVG
jgi:ABC-2 type transport system ATP-binding protein